MSEEIAFKLQKILSEVFEGWKVLKTTVVTQEYEIPRESFVSHLTTDVVTLVVRKNKRQNGDGTWGNEFHSLSVPNNKKPLTTEQALRSLKHLGFTIDDEPIRKAVDCMVACLNGERRIDNYREKTRDWDLFTKLMLSTWVKIFDPVII